MWPYESILIAALALSPGLALANPLNVRYAADAAKRATCTFTNFNDVAEGQKDCSAITISSMSVPAGETLDLTSLKDGATVNFEGTTTFGYKEWVGPLMAISGNDITVTGSSGNKIDGNGAQYWDGEGGSGGKTKPKFFAVRNMKGSTITGLNFYNSPVALFAIAGADGLKISNILYDNSAGASLGKNTDAFDVGGDSTNVVISGCTVTNQDDCLAVNSGSQITFESNSCTGGHGLSIGSIASGKKVSNVTISNNKVINSQNGCRIKTDASATGGSVSGVTFKSNTLQGITKYGIIIQQNYPNTDGTPTAGIPITDLTMEDITGTVTSSAVEIAIICAACSNWEWSDVSITGGKKDTDCQGVPSGASC